MIGRVLALAARTYARYVVPLTLLSLLVFAPLLVVVARIAPPANVAQARELVRVLWVVALFAFAALFLVAGAAGPLARSLASAAPLGPFVGARAAVRGLAGAMLPALAALIALAVGLAALVVPGLVLLPLFAYAGASTARGVSARLADSAAIARAHIRVAIAGVAIVACVIAIAVAVAYLRLPLPVPRKPPPAALAAIATSILGSLRYLALGLALGAPLLASLLAAVPALHAPADATQVDR